MGQISQMFQSIPDKTDIRNYLYNTVAEINTQLSGIDASINDVIQLDASVVASIARIDVSLNNTFDASIIFYNKTGGLISGDVSINGKINVDSSIIFKAFNDTSLFYFDVNVSGALIARIIS